MRTGGSFQFGLIAIEGILGDALDRTPPHGQQRTPIAWRRCSLRCRTANMSMSGSPGERPLLAQRHLAD